jgi:cell division protein FtsB
VLLPSNVAKVLGFSPEKVKMSASDKEIEALQKEVDQLTAKATVIMKRIQKLKN